MIKGLYTAGVSMKSKMRQMDIISNNLANADTTGYKKDSTVSGKFEVALKNRMDKKEIATIDSVYTDFKQGSFQRTDNKLDVAIKGKGFFAIENDGEKYSRDGIFTLDNEGFLTTKSGDKVLGENGEIKLESDDININNQGEIYQGKKLVDKLKLVDFEDYKNLEKVGDNLLKANDKAKISDDTVQVSQGYIEKSNVNTIEEMVSMISTMRSYEANQKLVKAHDDMLQKAANDVGRV